MVVTKKQIYSLLAALCISLGMCLLISPDMVYADNDQQEQACMHVWSEWYLEEYATCTEKGVEKRTCYACNTSETRTIAAYGHYWSDYWTSANPTVFAFGKETRTCYNCGASDERNISKLIPFALFDKKTFKVAPKKSIDLSEYLELEEGDYVVKWKVNKKKLAKINKAGKLKAKKNKGTVKVTATLASGLKVTCKVKIAKVKKSGGGKVYWTPSGSVYHKSSDCPTLSRSRTIKSGSIKKSGKRRCCKVCG